MINDYVVIKKMNFFKDDEIEVINDIKDTYNSDKNKAFSNPRFLRNFCKNKSIDFFSNIHSMMEMKNSEIQKYFDVIQK